MLKVWSFGANNTGQLGLGFSSEQVSVPTQVHDADLIPDDDGTPDEEVEFLIQGGGSHTTILKDNCSALTVSTVHLGLISTKNPCPKNQILPKPKVGPPLCQVQIVSGWDFSLLLNSDGVLYSLGDNSYGQLGRKTEAKFAPTWDQVPIAFKVRSVSAGMRHALAIGAGPECRVFAWGENAKGQTGLGSDFKVISEPTLLDNLNIGIEPRLIRCTRTSTILLSDSGHFYGVGLNKFGILGQQGPVPLVPQFTELFTEEGIQRLFVNHVRDFQCGWNHVLVLLSDGTLISWGRNNFNQLGRSCRGDFDYDLRPDYVQGIPEPITSISCGSEHNLVLGASGQIYSWGWNEHDNCGVKNLTSSQSIQGPESDHVIHSPTKVLIPDSEEVIVIGCGAGNSFAVSRSRK